VELTATIPHLDLIEGCKRGDPRSYKLLYDQYSKAMFNTSLRILNSAADAEDVLQEAFLDAFRNLDKFEKRSSFGAWLKQIVVNKSINLLRKRKVDIIDMEKVSGEDIAEEKGIDEKEMQWQVKQVMDSIKMLPHGYRTVLSLYLLEGYDHEEIADILQVAESTVRTQYMRAKQKLLGMMQQKRA
jgi:RNA polymerase sigma factor (sigma-70 family)